jgi:hypothetical protein
MPVTPSSFHGARFRAAAVDLVLVLGMAILTACATSEQGGNGDRGAGTPSGSLILSGPAFGKRTLLPTVCLAGERELFQGFDLRDEKAGVVTRLIVDPATGPVVRVFAASAPFDKTVLFHRSECRAFHFSLERTGWRINRIDQLDVSLDLDCQLSSGEGIVGKVAAPGCL